MLYLSVCYACLSVYYTCLSVKSVCLFVIPVILSCCLDNWTLFQLEDLCLDSKWHSVPFRVLYFPMDPGQKECAIQEIGCHLGEDYVFN